MIRNLRVVLLALAAVVLSACARGEHVVRTGDGTYQIEAYVMSGMRYKGDDLITFQARALLKAAEVAQSNGRNYFRIRSQKKYRYHGGGVVSTGSFTVYVPGPSLPPGRDTGRYRLWIELLDGSEAKAVDELVFEAAQVIRAFPNIKELVAKLEKVPENDAGFAAEENHTQRNLPPARQ